MEISEDVKELYDYVENSRHENNGRLTPAQAGAVLDKLFFIHRALVIAEYRPPLSDGGDYRRDRSYLSPPRSRGSLPPGPALDPMLLARGGAIKTYPRPSFLKKLFKRRLI